MRLKLWTSALVFAVLPATTNYRLNSYGFGSGSTAKSQTATYALEGGSGELAGQTNATINTMAKPGFTETQQANLPKLAALDNNSGAYYNKLHFVIDAQSNPSDTKYLVAVSTDNFVANTSYLQIDGTLSPTLLLNDYQTYSFWGGSSGSLIVGLNSSTTYSVRLKATQGGFSESAFGPIATQATAGPSLSFGLSTSAQAAAPLTVALGTLNSGIISNASQTINFGLSTNGVGGATIYGASQNGGLLSSSTGYLINAFDGDLAANPAGFGAQSTALNQSTGGPLTALAPYDGSGTTIGGLLTSLRGVYNTSVPVSAGTASLSLKAKTSANGIAATDYREVLTFTAAGNF